MKNIKKANTKTKVTKKLNPISHLKLKTEIKAGYYLGITLSAGAEKSQLG